MQEFIGAIAVVVIILFFLILLATSIGFWTGATYPQQTLQEFIKPCLEQGYTKTHCIKKAREIGIDWESVL